MNRELAEVRRYWPKAKIVEVAIGHEVTYAVGDARAVVAVLPRRHSYVRGWYGRTIAEAMRAAGFGVRAQGLRQVMNSLKRNDCAGRILPGPRIKPHKWFVELQSCQRPRKGARLGKRKREVPDEP